MDLPVFRLNRLKAFKKRFRKKPNFSRFPFFFKKTFFILPCQQDVSRRLTRETVTLYGYLPE